MQAKNDYNFRGANQKEEPRLRSAKQDGRGSSNYTTRGKHELGNPYNRSVALPNDWVI